MLAEHVLRAVVGHVQFQLACAAAALQSQRRLARGVHHDRAAQRLAQRAQLELPAPLVRSLHPWTHLGATQTELWGVGRVVCAVNPQRANGSRLAEQGASGDAVDAPDLTGN